MNVHRRTPVTSETIRLWSEYVGAAPTMALILHCGMEKRLSRESHNLKNGGSNPSPATKSIKSIQRGIQQTHFNFGKNIENPLVKAKGISAIIK